MNFLVQRSSASALKRNQIMSRAIRSSKRRVAKLCAVFIDLEPPGNAKICRVAGDLDLGFDARPQARLVDRIVLPDSSSGAPRSSIRSLVAALSKQSDWPSSKR